MILVGDHANDPHVRAVADQLPANWVVALDATRQAEVVRRLDLHRTVLTDMAGGMVEVSGDSPGRGWIRRLAPAGWDQGVMLGGHAAAVLSSRLTLLAAILRDPSVSWVTSVDDLFPAENKLVQYRAALTAGVRVPRTLITPSPAELADELGAEFIMKPLGPGNFEDRDRQHVVYTRPVRAGELAQADLLDAPFLAQEVIAARRHLRVVTVREQVWVTELDATGLPVDWRRDAAAHHAFTVAEAWPEVERAALRLTAALSVGFSSQDWVVDDTGPVFLDLNPGGQWLFLPEAVTGPVARALAQWLAER